MTNLKNSYSHTYAKTHRAAKAGLKQSGPDKNISVSEGCPYTAYPRDRRYVVHPQGKEYIKTICPIQKRVAIHWKGIAEVLGERYA